MFHIDMILEITTKQELENLSWEWRRCRKGSVNRRVIFQQKKLEENVIQHIEGEMKLGKSIIIHPMETLKTKGLSRLVTHGKWINVSINSL